MATFNQSTVAGTSSPYSYKQRRTTAGIGESWGAIHSGAGNSQVETDGGCIITAGTNTSAWDELTRNVISFDMAVPASFPTKYFQVSAVTVSVFAATILSPVGSVWSTDAKRGLGLTLTSESSILSTASTADYQAVFTGGFTEIATRINQSAISASSWIDFTLNSTGIAYVNSALSKANHPDNLYFAVCFGGDIDNTTPTWASASDRIGYNFNGTSAGTNLPKIAVTYDPSVQINIGDSWKVVESAQINIGDVWKDVPEMNINIGDDWKEV